MRMFSEGVGIPINWEYYGVLKQPIQQGGDNNRVTEDIGSLPESMVAGLDHGAMLVAGELWSPLIRMGTHL